MVGAGTGVAPFRGFWQQKQASKSSNKNKCHHLLLEFIILSFFYVEGAVKMGPMFLFTGCRTRETDLYSKEKLEMVQSGVLDGAFLALSRDPVIPKVNAIGYDLKIIDLMILLLYKFTDLRSGSTVRRG